MAGDLHSAQIIIPFVGYTISKNQRVRWHGTVVGVAFRI
jgi:hypothetical protein